MGFPEGLELKAYSQQLLAGREAKGWTQQQLSKKLLLPVHFIRALESGEHGMLPEMPYVMSMYRKVATALGIDPEPMIQACKDFQEQERQPPDEQAQPQPEEAAHVRQLSSPGPKKQRMELIKPEAAPVPQPTPPKKRRTGKGKGDGVIVLLGCGLGLALVALVLLNSEFWPAIRSRLITTDPEAETVAETQDQASEALAAQQQPITDISEDTPVSPEQQTEGPELGTVRFIFTADVEDSRSSWISIQDARSVVLFEGTPDPSTSVDLPIAAGIRVRLGRPGLVLWQQPGQPPQPIPESQPGVWIELFPGPTASQVAPAPLEADPLAPESAPVSAPEAP